MLGMTRRIGFGIPLLLAFVVPYALFGEATRSLRESASGLFAQQSEAVRSADSLSDLWAAGSSLPPANFADVTASVPEPLDLPTALRFEVTPRWVLSRWPSVTTTRSEQQFEGLRVPLITGTGPFDLAGSLTYYFDQQSQLQRISFSGATGDERHVVSVLTRQFGMQLQPSLNATIYLNSWNGKPTSALVIRRRAVVQAAAENGNYEVHLEINRPNHFFGLSTQFEQLLATATAGPSTTTQLR